MSNFIRSFALALAIVVPGVQCRAQEQNDSEEFLDSIFSIQEVSIVEVKNKLIIKPQTLSGPQLHNLNSNTVADALRYFSGVQLKDYGGIGGIKTINIRSMGSSHVGVFYNGIQLANAQNGQVDLGRYSLDNIEEISLYNGQKSEIFQTAKDFCSASAIYINTRRPRFKDGKNYNIVGQLKTGSFGLVNPSFLWEQKLTDHILLSVNTEYTYANGKYKFRYKRKALDGSLAYDTTATRQNGDVEALRGEIGLYGYIPMGKWNLNGYMYISERGIPGAIVNNVFKHGERQWDKTFFGQGAFEKEISDFYKLKINSKFTWDYSNFLRDDPKELYLNNHYYQQEAYLSMANLFTLKDWWEVSCALDGQMNKLHSDAKDCTHPLRWAEMISLATAFNFEKFSAQASVLGMFVQEHIDSKKAFMKSPNQSEFSPAVFLFYKPFDDIDLKFNGFYKRIFRMPTFNEMYYRDLSTNLKPEFTNQYDLGLTYNKTFSHPFFNMINCRVDVYYNEVTDKIIAYPAGQLFWKVLNLGRVKIKGLEVSSDLLAHIRKLNLKWHVQYTFQKAQDFTDKADDFYGDQIPYIPKHSASTSLNLNWMNWDLNYSFIYTGERYSARENIRSNFEPPWYTHDLSLSKDFTFKKVECKIAGELNNIFNQAYEVIHNYPMPGRNFKISLKVKL